MDIVAEQFPATGASPMRESSSSGSWITKQFWQQLISSRWPERNRGSGGIWKATRWVALLVGFAGAALAEGTHTITIDGNFSDWTNVPSHYDPVGTDVHNGIPNTHDTDGKTATYIPVYVNHPDVDLLEYKFTHDSSNLYAYFRATGVIGNTISNATQHGRYYVIVTIDVDNHTDTGYSLCEGGYYPTSDGYDMNMEFEFYDGHPNKGNYLNHGATNQTQLDAAFQDQMNGIVRVLPGAYDFYPEWVWFDSPSGPNSGTNNLPPPEDYASIRFVKDKGPSYQGIIRLALSPDGHQAEMVAPFRGFMRDASQPHVSARPIISLGKTINVSFSLEASGELAPGGQWASNTAEPIVGYYLGFPEPRLKIAPSVPNGNVVVTWFSGAIGMKLLRTPSLTNPDWQLVSGSDTTNQMTLAIGTGNAFFRLVEP
jgi:hypothetical protein